MAVDGPHGRRLLWVAGAPDDCERWAWEALPAEARDATLWVATRPRYPVAATPPARVAGRLGGECAVLVYDAHQGFHPDAFAAAVGTLRGGGDCVVLTPPREAWADYVDPDLARLACHPYTAADMRRLFLRRLNERWRHDPAVDRLSPEDPPRLRCAAPPAPFFRLGRDQAALLDRVHSVARGHARRPLVLVADRGRGKSTLLGVAAARLLLDGTGCVSVVAPTRQAAATLFRHAAREAGLPDAGVRDRRIGTGVLRFRLPVESARQPDEDADLLLVDEAAAISVGLLDLLLSRHNRVVFASTRHGYEGSGRGFTLRFEAVLDRRTPGWRKAELSTPLRWAEDDPLEALVHRSLLLDVDLPAAPPADADVEVGPVDPATLAEDEALLRAAFGLLVNAHYQTRPSDLRHLLDNRAGTLWVARRASAVVGVLFATVEGGFDADMAARILSGARRPRGHLLPQSLAVHGGLDGCLGRRLLRVQRIAVHPGLRRRGTARALLEHAARWGAAHGCALLGCAYGVDRALLAFWQACGFTPARLGLRTDPSSGAPSLLMLRGLEPAGEALADEARRAFLAALPWQLGGAHRDLDAVLAAMLLHGRDCSDLPLSARDRRELRRIGAGSRAAATADDLLWKWLVHAGAAGPHSPEALAPLLAWRLQHRTLDDIGRTFAVAPGRRPLEERLRELIRAAPPAGKGAG